jgi:MFS family permease
MNRLLYLNRFLTSFADYGLMFLIPLVVFQSTGDAALSGLAFSIEYLVKVLFGPATGLLVDRYPLIKLIAGANALRVLASAMSALLISWFPTFTVIVSLAVINGIGFTINFMSQETLLTELVEEKYFAKIQAKVQSLEQVALVTAPLLFAVLLGAMGTAYSLGVVSLLFLASTLSLGIGSAHLALGIPPDHGTSWRLQFISNLKVGQRYLVQSRPLQKIVASTFLINLIYGTLLATGAVVVTGMFEQTAADFAGLQTAGAVMAIIILSLIAKYSTRFTPTELGFMAFIMMSLGGVIVGITHQFWLYGIGFVLILSFDGVFNVYIRTRRMEIIARKDFGKAIGLLMIVNNLSKPLSGFIVYVLTPWLSVTQIILVATLITVISTLSFKLFSTKEQSVTAIHPQ